MTIQDFINKGFPDHVVADGIFYMWLYMAGPKSERGPKQERFTARIQLYDMDDYGVNLLHLLQTNRNSTLVWAAETLLEFLPRNLQEEYLDEYIKFCTFTGTVWANEARILQVIASLFDVSDESLKKKIKKFGEKPLKQIISKQEPAGSLLDSEEIKASIIRLRSKFKLGRRDAVEEKESEPTRAPSKSQNESRPVTSTQKKKPASSKSKKNIPSSPTSPTERPKKTSPKPGPTKIDSKPREVTETGVIIFLFGALLLFLFNYDFTSDKTQQISTVNTPQTETRVQNERNGSSVTTNINPTSRSANRLEYVNKLVFSQNPIRIYHANLNPVGWLDEGSIYLVSSEGSETITIETEDGRYRAFKRFFTVYDEISFTPVFSGPVIYSTENVQLRRELTFASKTSNILPQNRPVRLLSETATSVQIRWRGNTYWARKDKFQNRSLASDISINHSRNHSTEDIDFIYKFTNLAADANVRSSPNIFSDVVFQLNKGDRVLVSHKIPNTMFYRVFISGDKYYLPDFAIQIEN